MSLPAGARLGPYEILAPLGAGGMGEVYRARDARLNREIAVKVLPASFADNPDRLRRFEQEARATGMLNHPNILAVYDVGTQDGVPYLVTELLEGRTLREELPVPRRKALDYARQIATGLAAAHAKGVTHRDLKPENLFVTSDGRVKILDFGLAKVEEASNELTRTAGTTPGVALGTVGYMSPEQALGKAADHRCDVFSLGAILYEMLSGSRAFQAPSGIETLNAILKADPPPLSDAALDRIVRRCLEKSPEQRFQSASDLAFDLEMLSGASSTLRAAVQAEPVWKHASRAVYAVATAAALAAVTFAGLWWQARRDAVRPDWTAIRLGGPEIAMTPRISPNGQMLAFLAMVDGQTQVAVMNPDSGNWTVLTHDRTNGIAGTLCWSREGDKIFFDRVSDILRGVYSVPALGGEEQLILEEASSPEVVPDGSLLVARINKERKRQLHRFWPATGRLEPLAAATVFAQARVFPDGKEAAFIGQPLVSTTPEPPFGYYAINLASGQTRRLGSDVKLGGGFAISPGGNSILVSGRSGDLVKLIEAPRDGKSSGKTIFNLGLITPGLDVFKDGSIYLDQWDRPNDMLRVGASGGAPERVASVPIGFAPTQISNGRVLFVSVLSGRAKLLMTKPGKEPAPFAQTEEDIFGLNPMGEKELILRVGKLDQDAGSMLVVASAADGRIVRRLEVTKDLAIASFAASPDASTVYYSASGSIWSLPVAGGAPRKLAAGDGVASDPNGRDLIVTRNEKDAVHLVRVPVSGGSEQPIPLTSNLRLLYIGPNPVGKDGRILVAVQSLDSWWNEIGILDPRTGHVEKLTVPYSGDIDNASWTPDGRILAVGSRMQAGLWRYRREK